MLEIYTRKKANYTENDLGENMILDKVIVMDDVSGRADRSDEFANFLFTKIRTEVCAYLSHHTPQDRTGK